MTRPLRSSQLDGLAALLGQLAEALADGGPGRVQLQRMKDHARARGYPTGGSGVGPGRGAESSSTERAALLEDPTLRDYDAAVKLLGRMMGDARKVSDLLGAYGRQKVTVCPRCSVEIPAGRVRCPQCKQHPDTRICENLSCLRPLNPGERMREGTDGVSRCESCHWFWRKHRRDRTADDMRSSA